MESRSHIQHEVFNAEGIQRLQSFNAEGIQRLQSFNAEGIQHKVFNAEGIQPKFLTFATNFFLNMELIDFILHIDQHLNAFIIEYHYWVYVILFAIIFIETGLVIMPFLPGDSLIFAVGMFAAQGSLDLSISIAVLLSAAILGDGCNYLIGKFVGHRILEWKLFNRKLVKPEHLEKTHQFYEKHGAKTIIIARFVPFVRTFAPFVAGVGNMSYKTFTSYNVIGGILWVVGISLIGFFLGNNEIVKANFEKVVFLIIFISVLPVIIAFVKARFEKKKESPAV